MCSCNINPSEVLAHLNQLGYQNITPQQLKDFIKDLKKLIKHEQKRQEAKENIEPTRKRVTNESVVSIQIRDCCVKRDATVTEASSQSITEPETVPEASSPRITKPQTETKSVGSGKDPSSKSGKTKTASVPHKKSNKSKVRTLSESENTVLSESFYLDSALTSKKNVGCNTNTAVCKKATKVQFCGDLEITKPSYIICQNPVKTIKSDPVALYHKYQEEWKKFKLPGENMHKNLRWAIRERMCGVTPQTMSAAPSMEAIARTRKCCRI